MSVVNLSGYSTPHFLPTSTEAFLKLDQSRTAGPITAQSTYFHTGTSGTLKLTRRRNFTCLNGSQFKEEVDSLWVVWYFEGIVLTRRHQWVICQEIHMAIFVNDDTVTSNSVKMMYCWVSFTVMHLLWMQVALYATSLRSVCAQCVFWVSWVTPHSLCSVYGFTGLSPIHSWHFPCCSSSIQFCFCIAFSYLSLQTDRITDWQ